MNQRAFTLIEMLIVIIIIGILMSLLIVLVSGTEERAKNNRTLGLIKVLSDGVEAYHMKTKGQGYPPGAGEGLAHSSMYLHRYLGQELRVPRTFHSGGTVEYEKVGPLVEFKGGYLDGGVLSSPGDAKNNPKKIVDSWNNPIDYSNPNVNPWEVKLPFTIRSAGKDGDMNTTEDNVTNKDRQ